MNKKIILTIACLLILGFNAQAADYRKPSATCFDYGGEEKQQFPKCPPDFKKDCLARNGVVEGMPYAPALFQLACFQIAPDAGKACSEDQECLSGLCDLGSAITSQKCTLVKKDYRAENKYYTATYACPTPKPGKCTISPRNEEGFGSGVRLSQTMNHYFLIETRTPDVQI